MVHQRVRLGHRSRPAGELEPYPNTTIPAQTTSYQNPNGEVADEYMRFYVAN